MDEMNVKVKDQYWVNSDVFEWATTPEYWILPICRFQKVLLKKNGMNEESNQRSWSIFGVLRWWRCVLKMIRILSDEWMNQRLFYLWMDWMNCCCVVTLLRLWSVSAKRDKVSLSVFVLAAKVILGPLTDSGAFKGNFEMEKWRY